MNIHPPLGLTARPFDFLIAFLLFFAGGYGFLDPDWPPDVGFMSYVILIEDAYLVSSGVMIMAALVIKQCALRGVCRRDGIIVRAVIGEMYAWLFAAVAAAVIVATSWYVPPTALHFDGTTQQIVAWSALWAAVALAALIRFRDMRGYYLNNGAKGYDHHGD